MKCLWKTVDHQIVAESRTRATFCKNVHKCSSNLVIQTMTFKNFLHTFHPRQEKPGSGLREDTPQQKLWGLWWRKNCTRNDQCIFGHALCRFANGMFLFGDDMRMFTNDLFQSGYGMFWFCTNLFLFGKKMCVLGNDMPLLGMLCFTWRDAQKSFKGNTQNVREPSGSQEHAYAHILCFATFEVLGFVLF